MKRFGLIVISCILFFGCKIKEKPEFLGLNKIKVVNVDSQNITLSADALFKNPNDVGGILKTKGLKVFVNEKKVANIVSEEFDVPSKNEFTIPLVVSIATDSLVDKNNLGSLLGSLISQRLKVRYQGEINYKVLGFSSAYNIDEERIIKVKL
ncbi:LEA type 2 family protein [Winogradskyella sp. D23]|jgi:hypothetical protein|uniref:LEA type 2 family protein n=2 Tax=Winogradskyella alexanderae TaxID=2877123 RepID=A0ABS7XSR3_9FLAO|nr:LEA type 2 family protein [Winogradskyella alexanderae]